MKLNYQEKKLLQLLIKNEINALKDALPYLDNKSTEHKKILNKKELLITLNKKLDNTSIPGASLKQIDSLTKTAKKRMKVSNEKVQNAINLLNLYNKKITMNSVANEAGMSYNTVKKYKQIIENAENNRTKGV